MDSIQTLKDASVKGKRVLLRVDFNVPICEKRRVVTDNTRIQASLPTIKYLVDYGAKVIVMSHLGRPNGTVKENLRLCKVAKELSKLSGHKIKKLDYLIGKDVEDEISKMKNGDIVVLENTRFYKEEELSDPKFVKKLAKLGDIFVSDAFGVVHRKHATTAGIADYLPAYAGLLLEKEIRGLTPLLRNPQRPLTLIVGGSKTATKIGVLKNFMDKADYFLIGGGLANTFLYATGYNIGKSLCEVDKKEVAREIMLEAEKKKRHFILPNDVIVASEISKDAKTLCVPVQDVEGDMKILDIGLMSVTRFLEVIKKSKTIVWNGPMGLSELKPFSNGTKQITKAVAQSDAVTILGGGDTLEVIRKFGYSSDNFTHVSTGGGAMLEFLAGTELPGLTALKNRK